MNIDDIIENARLKGRVIALEAEIERLRSSSFVTVVPSEEYEKLKAELAKSEEHNSALCERLADLNAEVHTASCANANMHKENARLKTEVERLTVEADWKTPARKIRALEAEVERLRKAGDALSKFAMHNDTSSELWMAWNAAKEGKQS